MWKASSSVYHEHLLKNLKGLGLKNSGLHPLRTSVSQTRQKDIRWEVGITQAWQLHLFRGFCSRGEAGAYLYWLNPTPRSGTEVPNSTVVTVPGRHGLVLGRVQA